MTKTAITKYDVGLFEPVRQLDEPLDLSRVIRSSPYYEKDHLLEVQKLEPRYGAISLALQSFQPNHGKTDYAFIDYLEAFNIHQIVSQYRKYVKILEISDPNIELYVIAFRSILHEEVQQSEDKRSQLAVIDKDSHREANLSGGLLKYWYGTPDDVHAQNLATCWWVNQIDAKRGGGGAAHREGMRRVKGWYKKWEVEEYSLQITEDNFTLTNLREHLNI